jgi:hypothetical protein
VEPNHLSDWAESRKSRPGGRLFAMPGCKLRQAHELPPDCTCDACGRAIGASEPRQRCASNSCDDMHLCIACAATACACPTCGASSGRLYRDRASPFVLRSLLFREAFDAHADSADVVHPQRMVARAFAVYAERPLLGEAASDGSSVQWWSYADCGAAARRLAQELRRSCGHDGEHGGLRPAVAICASNGVGWLVCDWACVLAGKLVS